MPCVGPRNFSHIDDYVYDFCPLSLIHMLVLLYLCVMLTTLFPFVLGSKLFCACLASVQISAPYVSWQHTCVGHLSLQAGGDKPSFYLHARVLPD